MSSADSEKPMNLYEMWAANGNAGGFWVRRNSWSGTVARVVSLAGETTGEMPASAPRYGGPEIRADVFDLESGKLRYTRSVLAAAGSVGYKRIDPPAWARTSARA